MCEGKQDFCHSWHDCTSDHAAVKLQERKSSTDMLFMLITLHLVTIQGVYRVYYEKVIENNSTKVSFWLSFLNS